MARHLSQLDPFIGGLALDSVYSGTLQPFIEHRRQAGVKVKSINLALGVVRRILNVAARLWRDEHGLTWLENPPLIQLLPDSTAREPYPLDWEEQRRLFDSHPLQRVDHLLQLLRGRPHFQCQFRHQFLLNYRPSVHQETALRTIHCGRRCLSR